jgi:hypothetical protein
MREPSSEIQRTLRNGRRVRGSSAPDVARRSELASIARVNAENHRRSLDALRRQRHAIRRLTRSHAELSEKVTHLEKRTEQAVVSITQGLIGLDRRVTQATRSSVVTATAEGSPAPPRALPIREAQRLQHLQQMREVKALAFRAQIQNVTNVVNSAQMAAFGEKGSVFATNNLILAGNQLFWSLLEPVLRGFGALDAATGTVVAALAPLGTLVTGQLALGERQHVRVISGVTTFTRLPQVISESLRGRVAEGLWPTFRKRTDVPVTVNVVGVAAATLTALAIVDQGTLHIGLFRNRDVGLAAGGPIALNPPVQVAWTVDTGVGSG